MKSHNGVELTPKFWELLQDPKPPKALVTLRIDSDVLTYFKGTGKKYQTLMNNVLQAYMLSQQD